MTKAFTMIELIFVIVILGVLAAVAIPKLSATRDDAKISSMAHAIKTGASEIVANVVSQGSADSNLSDLSDVLSSLIYSGDATLSAVNKVDFKMGSVGNCIIMQKISSGNDINLSMSFTATADVKCTQLQSIVNMSEYQIPLSGENIDY